MQREAKVPVLKPEKVNPENVKKRGGRKLLFLLVALFITVLIILFFQSSLSKITKVEIVGNELLTTQAIGQAAKVNIGDHFFSLSAHNVELRVKKLASIESVKVTKTFPGLIKIAVKEFPRVAFQLSDGGSKAALLADGSVISLKGVSVPFDRPLLTSWKDDDPLKIKLCRVLGEIPLALLSDVSEIKPNPSVAYADKIKIYTRSKFEINTTIEYLPSKIPYFSYMINDMKEGQNITSGVLTLLDSDRGSGFEKDTKPAEPKPTTEPKKR